jgi:Tfp pilus assembly protein PilX
VRRAAPKRERGAVLLIVLVLLMALVWFAMSAMRIGRQNLTIVGNRQAETHATAAAQNAIEHTISSDAFTKDPAAVAAVPIPVDIDGDGTADFTAMLDPQPKCVRIRPMKANEITVSDIEKMIATSRTGCLGSTQQAGTANGGFVEAGGPVAAGNTPCFLTEWKVSAAVNDPVTHTDVAVHQGVRIRLLKEDAENSCK